MNIEEMLPKAGAELPTPHGRFTVERVDWTKQSDGTVKGNIHIEFHLRPSQDMSDDGGEILASVNWPALKIRDRRSKH